MLCSSLALTQQACISNPRADHSPKLSDSSSASRRRAHSQSSLGCAQKEGRSNTNLPNFSSQYEERFHRGFCTPPILLLHLMKEIDFKSPGSPGSVRVVSSHRLVTSSARLTMYGYFPTKTFRRWWGSNSGTQFPPAIAIVECHGPVFRPEVLLDRSCKNQFYIAAVGVGVLTFESW